MDPVDETDMIVPSGPDDATPELRLGRGTALDLAAKFVGLGTSFLIGVLVARVFGAEGKGALSIIMQVPGILVVVLDLGISTSTLYFVSRGELKPGTAAGNAALMALAISAIGLPVVYLLLAGPLAILPGLSPWTVALAMCILPLGLLVGWFGGISTGLGNLKLPLWCGIAAAATTMAILVVVLVTGHGSLTTVLGASVAGTVASLAVLVVGLRRYLTPLRIDVPASRRMARFSAKAYLTSIAGLLHERQDVLVLGWLAGAGAVGLYSVGVSFAELAWYVPSALGTAILAKGSRRSELSAVDYTTRATRIAMVFMTVTVLGSLVVVPLFIPLVYGRAFAPAVFAFLALLPGVLADGVSRILWNYQTTRGRLYWRMAIGTTVLNLAAIVVLAPTFGAVGAALASSISYGALAVLVTRRFCADTGATLAQVFLPTREDIGVVVRTSRELLRRSA